MPAGTSSGLGDTSGERGSASPLSSSYDLDYAVGLDARPSEVLLLSRESDEDTVTFLPPPPEYGASSDSTGRGNCKSYKPLPPIPDDVKRLHQDASGAVTPPTYAELAAQYKQAVQRSLSSSGRDAASNRQSRRGSDCVHQWLSLEDGTIQPASSRRPQTGLISVSQTLFCSFLACFCIPIIGWVPLAFACVSVQDNAPSHPSTQRVRKFVIMASSVCIIIGLAMSTGLLVRCVRSGNCDEFANHWRNHWKFHGNSSRPVHSH